jgi:HlyD family secretion protein
MRRYLSIIVLLFLITSCGEERKSTKVKERDLVESVYSSVNIEPQILYVVNSATPGYIQEIFKNAGDQVIVGEPVISIQDDPTKLQLDNARLYTEQAQRNLKSDFSALEDVKLEISNLSLKRKNDSLNFTRVKTLTLKDLATTQELEQAELLFQTSKSAHVGAVKRYKRMRKDLETAVKQAQNNMKTSLSRSADLVIESKLEGAVYQVLKERGEYVMMQEPIALIGSNREFKIKLMVDESDISRLKIGQKVVVKLEAYKDKVFEAQVSKIHPRLDSRTQTFEVEGIFTQQPEKLFLGLTGEANIVTGIKKDVLTIPLEYLQEGDYVETDEGRIKVKVGSRNLSFVEILSGLSKDQKIYKSE